MSSYNLLRESWIGVLDPENTYARVGIVHLLTNAHRYTVLADSQPIVTASIHRLLTAILQDIYKPQKFPDLERIWASGKFDAGLIEQFAVEHAERFDLFGETPFFQSADIDPSSAEDSVCRLTQWLPSGTESLHKMAYGTEMLSPIDCARALVAIPAFMTIGGVGYTASINGTPPVYVFPSGNNLFESLAASLLTPPFYNSDVGAAWWQRSPVISRNGKNRYASIGYLHGLTFMPRRIRLRQDNDGMVRKIVFGPGEAVDKGIAWRDPFVPYNVRKTGMFPITPDIDVQWRDTLSFLLTTEKADRLRPSWLDCLANLDTRNSREIWTTWCVTLATNQMSVRAASLHVDMLPIRAITDPKVAYAIESGLVRIDKLTGKLAKALVEAGLNHNDWARSFWAVLEQPYRYCLLHGGEIDTEVAKVARATIGEFLDTLPVSSQWLRVRYEVEDACGGIIGAYLKIKK